MSNHDFMSSDDIRHEFSMAMSAMYQEEVPLYGNLIDLVSEVNAEVLTTHPDTKTQLLHTGEIERLSMERHGAIRLGTATELSMMRRLFAVMGMYPVGYYDLAPAGVPVHSTAFRTLDPHSSHKSPFRVFTSLLRLDLIGDEALEREATATLQKRRIFTDEVIGLIERFEMQDGLIPEDAQCFIKEALQTFRWHDKTPVTKELYQRLLHQHPLIADVVGFKGPHINHLTPRTLDIDAAQQKMQAGGIPSKAIIEGPPRRACPILLRQTSFKALEEAVSFKTANIGDLDECCDGYEQGFHTARFGEIEQRGVALTPKGRALYDQLLNEARNQLGITPNEDNASQYYQILDETFSKFPDNYQALHDTDLAYFYYQLTDNIHDSCKDRALLAAAFDKVDLNAVSRAEISKLIDDGVIRIEPIVYEDFLPVSAAGIFQSNLNQSKNNSYDNASNQQEFEKALGSKVYDELKLYEEIQAQSLKKCLAGCS
ncbi:VOC family protein [Psychrobacter sp. NZS113]|uniref:2-oxoadipate dioxygenase/decarboxylase HglS n=1 Tax=Psychrobacter sp. NZS113 TaxID=2792045 RepID=UPI0018CCE139|nr:VOC family protein [Psychrobacter sp. NZS113]MBH0095751.1 VOC family protein [Psychrobacter sp. NZS113]